MPIPVPTLFECVSAVAVGENVIRLQFNGAVYFNDLLDKRDGSRITLYTVTKVSGTKGLDGSPVWDVYAIDAVLTDTTDETMFPLPSSGRYVDIITDRPMTPWPAQYRITLGDVYSTDFLDGFGKPERLSSLTREFTLYGNHREIQQPVVTEPERRKDLANATTARALVGKTESSPEWLGVFAVDDSGDVATDEGQISLMKRLYRRLFTKPGSFLHLGFTYGLGIQELVKKVGIQATLNLLKIRAEEQFAREPEVAKVKVDVFQDKTQPSLLWVSPKVKTKKGAYLKQNFPIHI